MNADTTTCPTCGTPITKGVLGGKCPACLKRVALAEETLPEDTVIVDRPSPKLAEPAPVGTFGHFDDYEIIETIARGGMGIVYRARQRRLKREVALKMVLSGSYANADELRRFRMEAEAVARLDHPNIVPLFEAGEQDGRPWFSMRLLEGGTLAKKLSDASGGKLEPRMAAALVQKIARAVHHAHQRGLLHRDLKPANILLDTKGEPYVSDFGLAKPVEDAGHTVTGAVLGTPGYMAPEQAAGKVSELTTAVDVFALGAILYHALVGKAPFGGSSSLEVLSNVIKCEPTRPSTTGARVHRDLETICLHCLAKEPDARYGSAEALAEDLERWLRGEPVLARRTGAFERTWLWARRKPAAAALVVLLAGLLLAGGVKVWRENSRLAASLKQEQVQRRASLFTEARLLQKSGAQGQRLAALDALQRSLALGIGADTRDEVAACLSMVDLKLLRTVDMGALADSKTGYGYTLSPDLSLCAWEKSPAKGSTHTWCLSDTKTGAVLRTFTYEAARDKLKFRFSPDGKRIAVREYTRTEIWEVEGDATAPIETLPAGEDLDADFIFLPDGGWMLLDSDGSITRKQPGQDFSTFLESKRNRNGYRRLAFDPVTRQIARHEVDGVACWNLDDGKQTFRKTLEGSELFLWHPFGGELLTDDKGRLGTLLMRGGSPPEDGKLWTKRFRGEGMDLTSTLLDTGYKTTAMDPQGRVLAILYRGTLKLLDAQSGGLLLTHEGLANDCLQFSTDGKQLAVVHSNRRLAFFELVTCDTWKTYPRPPGFAFNSDQEGAKDFTLSPDGELLLIQTAYGLRAWKIKQQQPPRSILPVPGSAPIQFHQMNYYPPCFDHETGDLVMLEPEPDSVTPDDFKVRTLPRLVRLSRTRITGESAPITPSDTELMPAKGAVAQIIAHESTWIIHDDGFELGLTEQDKHNYLIGRQKKRPATWAAWPHGDRTKAVELVKLPASVQPTVARASEDGRYFVVRETHLETKAQEVKVYAFGKPDAPLATLPGAEKAGYFRFSPDSQWLLVGMAAESLLFSIQEGAFTLAQTLPRSTSIKPRFSKDSKTLALGGTDGVIHLLSGPNLNQSLRLVPPQAVFCFVLNHDGSRLFLGGARGRVYEWDIARFRSEMNHLLGL